MQWIRWLLTHLKKDKRNLNNLRILFEQKDKQQKQVIPLNKQNHTYYIKQVYRYQLEKRLLQNAIPLGVPKSL